MRTFLITENRTKSIHVGREGRGRLVRRTGDGNYSPSAISEHEAGGFSCRVGEREPGEEANRNACK